MAERNQKQLSILQYDSRIVQQLKVLGMDEKWKAVMVVG